MFWWKSVRVKMAKGSSTLSRGLLLFIGLITFTDRLTYAIRVVLLDTTIVDGALNYKTHRGGVSGYGWREGSFNDGENVRRVYMACDIEHSEVSNWLRLPYIPRGDANRLYVEIEFTMRDCSTHRKPEEVFQCKETIALYYYEAMSDFATDTLPRWQAEQGSYQMVDSIAADYKFTNLSDYQINLKYRSVPVSKNGVYFAFLDEGACTSLLSINVYYITCPAVRKNFAFFNTTATGRDVSSVVSKEGVCVDNAVRVGNGPAPAYLCKSDGTWVWPTGQCYCKAGYQPNVDNTECLACPSGTYKATIGGDTCHSCPANSNADGKTRATICDCNPGYYRLPHANASQPCIEPPEAPSNLEIQFKDQTTLRVAWMAPDGGNAAHITYHVQCLKCNSQRGQCVECDSTVRYVPIQTGIQQTTVTLHSLNPSTNYKINVYSMNGISIPVTDFNHATIIVKTMDAIASKVDNVRVVSKNQTAILVAWDRPVEQHEQYEVKYFPTDNPFNALSVTTTSLRVIIGSLQASTQYSFQVRGKVFEGWGEWTLPVSVFTEAFITREVPTTTVSLAKDDKQTSPGFVNTDGIIAGAAVAVIVSLIIVAVMVVIYLKRNNQPCNEKNKSDCDQLHYSNVQYPPPVIVDTHMNGSLTMPLFAPPGVRTYVDPHTYEDPQQAVREFTKEIDASFITIESVIGGGEFGDVCKGKLRVPGKMELSVAIKTLKPGASDKSRMDFLTEASIMGQFDDPNVIYLEGVVTKSNPIMIITEFMENGALDQFLRTNDGKFTIIQLVGMLRGIASGMRYLSEMGYVHRDLAARNILVNDNLVCKVADFGLSREIESDTTDGAYTTRGGKIPVRWTAPEAISFRKFTSASDVWSYGVVAWEVMSYGERPYWNWSNQDVIKAVDKGYRLPPPMDCPEATHVLMLDCWQKERNQRPKFAQLVKTLDKLIRSPELLRKLAKSRPHNIFDPSVPDMTRFTSIEEWLCSIKMERYLDNFLQAGYENMEQVSRITVTELAHLGITLVGHQKKIMNSIQTLRAQLSGAVQMSEGFLV
ncbi:ephrin type-B receptor 1-B isoform X2 [Lingula anatina]|uniref:receptor protein-tyrosine kinase n=1 Tax=Lingula anatina TaxID=7574 RepID=A0A1S3I0T4_LINAN|nr:ephrin type-B receptor 1-B isoform X2 [Lingula anatina]|eukprot:XP_013391436.1 ephrin type-B receptor 1-B isoform X2 [Lingula anatina]